MIIYPLPRFALSIMNCDHRSRTNEESGWRTIITFNPKRQEPENRVSGTYCMYGTPDGKNDPAYAHRRQKADVHASTFSNEHPARSTVDAYWAAQASALHLSATEWQSEREKKTESKKIPPKQSRRRNRNANETHTQPTHPSRRAIPVNHALANYTGYTSAVLGRRWRAELRTVDGKGEQEGEGKGQRDVEERGQGGEQNTHQAKRQTSLT
jgi:hypothetical protein